jgi:hypothetical protein
MICFLTFSFGGKLNVLKSFSFRKTEGNKDFPFIAKLKVFFYVTKNQNRRKTELKEIKGPVHRIL